MDMPWNRLGCTEYTGLRSELITVPHHSTLLPYNGRVCLSAKTIPKSKSRVMYQAGALLRCPQAEQHGVLDRSTCSESCRKDSINHLALCRQRLVLRACSELQRSIGTESLVLRGGRRPLPCLWEVGAPLSCAEGRAVPNASIVTRNALVQSELSRCLRLWPANHTFTFTLRQPAIQKGIVFI